MEMAEDYPPCEETSRCRVMMGIIPSTTPRMGRRFPTRRSRICRRRASRLAGAALLACRRPPPQQKKRGISRRTVLIGAGVGAVGLGAAGAGLGAFLLQHKDSPATANVLTTDTAKMNHLLRRAGFGPTPTDLGEYLALGLSDAVDRLLNFSSVQDDLNSRLAAQNFDQTNPTELMREWLLRMIYSKRPLEEKMTLFWHGVLTSSFRDVGGKTHYLLHEAAERPAAQDGNGALRRPDGRDHG